MNNTELKQVFSQDQKNLVSDIQNLAESTIDTIEANFSCTHFISDFLLVLKNKFKTLSDDQFNSDANTDYKTWQNDMLNLISDDNIDYEKWENNRLNLHQKTKFENLSEKIPKKFRKLNPKSPLIEVFCLEETHMTIYNYLYHQIFLATISTFDSFLFDLLCLVLKAYPEKLENKEYKTNLTFDQLVKTIYNLPPSEINNIDEKIEELIVNDLYKLDKRFNNLKKYLKFQTSFLVEEWCKYQEMYLRRNAGVHNQWTDQNLYNEKRNKIIIFAENNKLDKTIINNLPKATDDFLGFDEDYLKESFKTFIKIIKELQDHCLKEFSNP